MKRADVGRGPVLIDHPAIESRVQPVREDIGQHVQRGLVLMKERHRGPPAVEPRVGHLFGHHDAAMDSPVHGGEHRTAGNPARRNRPEVAPDQLQRPSLVVVAGDDQHCVVRCVPGAEELVDLGEVGGGQVGHVPDDVPRIRMTRGKERVEHLFPRRSVGHVVHALQALVSHDLALGVQFGLVEDIEEIRHPVRFGPEREPESLLRHGLVVVRPVVARRPVHPAGRQARAGPLHQPDEVAVVVAGALEHEVLEEVGEPGAPRLLVL